MARFPRVVSPGVPHHVTQRGNARRLVFETDTDRLIYLELLNTYSQLHRLDLLGYCLMSNHVHLVASPCQPDSLAQTLRHTHGRYAAYWNARQGTSGHVWQGRYYSCPLDTEHLWAALRYTERNPVRAGMVSTPELYRWSSAGLHCGRAGTLPPHLDLTPWREVWDAPSWRQFLSAVDDAESDVASLRASTHTGRPRKPAPESAQSAFSF